MQDRVKLSRDEIIICYQEDVAKLMKYLSWLQSKSGSSTSDIYSGEGIGRNSMAVPVYDSTLLSFIKEIKTTDFLNRNYVYTYSRYRMKTAADELRVIDACSLQDITVLGDILSKYVLRGDVKGAVWSEGVQNGVYLALLLKLKELMEIRKPLEY
ncbi:MAG: hypothetical protein J6C19_06980 [Lachnospiraceae bacterium]|nr:hypothetical protein [Lachnospiraceae bacterium]MBO5145267.1 hypothetical protein [Lachnospiraceae bacterium]